jgi:hypothetical protein
MVLLAVVSYWFLCHFAIHAPDVLCGSATKELLGSWWSPSGIPAHGTGVSGHTGSHAG